MVNKLSLTAFEAVTRSQARIILKTLGSLLKYLFNHRDFLSSSCLRRILVALKD